MCFVVKMVYPHKAGNDGRGDSGNDRGSMAHLATVAFQEMINAKSRSYEGQTKPSFRRRPESMWKSGYPEHVEV